MVPCDTNAQLYGSHGNPFLNMRLRWLSQPKRFPTPVLVHRGRSLMVHRARPRSSRVQESRDKKVKLGLLPEQRAENFQGLEVSFGKLLLVLLYETPQTFKHWVCPLDLEALGQFAPVPIPAALSTPYKFPGSEAGFGLRTENICKSL